MPPETCAPSRVAISESVFPQPEWSVDILKYGGQDVVQIEVQETQRKPCFLIEEGVKSIFVRRAGSTVLATHADIIDMLHTDDEHASRPLPSDGQVRLLAPGIEQPKSGVEIIGQTLRGEAEYFRVIDLRTNREEPGLRADCHFGVALRDPELPGLSPAVG